MNLARLLLMSCVLCVAFTPLRALAQAPTPPAGGNTVVVTDPPPDEYRQMVSAAIQEFDDRNFDEALALFERAYALRASARVLRGIGKVRFEQRQYVRALDALDRSLVATIDPLTDAMRVEVGELRARAASYVGGLTITVNPPDARVTLDGRELGPETSYPIQLDIGAHVISADAEGHQRASRTVDVVGGRNTPVALDLITQRAGVVIVQGGRDTTGAWVTGAIGAGLVGATLGSVIWMMNRLDASSRCSDAEALGITCTTASSIASERDASIGTVVATSVLTTAAVVTFIVLLTSGSTRESASDVQVACAPAADGAGCALWGNF